MRTAARVLIVEDEFLVQTMLTEILHELGYAVVASAATLEDAKQQALRSDIDLAILDVNLRGEKVFPAADILESRDVPFCFVTGYGIEGVGNPYRTHPVLQKPFDEGDLARTLRKMWRKRSRPPDAVPVRSAKI
jgi:CheY-like chemotaxis protein